VDPGAEATEQLLMERSGVGTEGAEEGGEGIGGGNVSDVESEVSGGMDEG